MPRTRSSVYCTVWADDGWRVLSVGAQWLYWALLSQSKLSLAGCLVMQPARWSRFAQGTDVHPWLAELEMYGYIATDDDTDELVIRTFLTHDVCKGNMPTPMLKGVWSAWSAIESVELRQFVINNVPEVLWERTKDFTPPSALQMRRSAPLERSTPTVHPDGSSERPASTLPTTHVPLERPAPTARDDGSFDLPGEVIASGLEHARALRSAVAVTSEANSDRDSGSGGTA